MNKNVLNKILLITGLVLILLSALSAALIGMLNTAALISLALGLVCAGYAAFTERKTIITALSGKNAKQGINSVIYSILVVGIAVLVMAVAISNAKQFDLTKNKKYSLSDQTAKTLKALKKDIDAYYFFSVTAKNMEVEDTLKSYEKMNSKFRYNPVDADKNPAMGKKFNVDRYGVVVMSRKDNNTSETVDNLTEEGFTNAVLRLTNDIKKKVYFTQGHGEPSIDSPANDKSGYGSAKAALASQNYEAQQVELFTMTSVPRDAAVLIIAGPQADLFPNEIKVLKDYISNNGRVFVLYPPLVKLPNLESLISAYGFKPHNDIVVDKISKMLGGDFLMPVISSYESHEITKGFTVATFLPMCRTFELSGNAVSLSRTNPGSWGETDLAGIKEAKAGLDSKDIEGPLVVSAVTEIANEGNTTPAKAAIAVFGSSEFANNTFIASSGNRDMFLNVVSFLAQDSDKISIRPKGRNFEPLFISKIQGAMLFIIPIVLLPLLVITAGIMVFLRRRKP
ncbi:MAG: hypothetical protein CVV21_03840 [Candidatus Goldiibacteriota bacterium HGW-Goldbacteria-1]|jgi:ABC-type uncharacterized transport system involved in gliding motility auxiliary subunit|nr:MAG: hypothetical protein CVV21_03840 [Candidatus Goldiibacteriota bacterium HGW-Goldbacteria-1]